MDDILTPGEAWELFYAWATRPENWANIDFRGRDRIAKAQKAYMGLAAYPLGVEGIASLIREYGAEVFEVGVVFRRKVG